MKKILTSILAVLFLCLTGCSTISDGDIYDREFVAAHEESTIDYDPVSETFTTGSESVPDKWYISFRKVNENDGGWLTRRIEVDKPNYDAYKLGDHISLK
jgi:hypothetical protein